MVLLPMTSGQIFKVGFLCAFVSTFAWRLYSVFFQVREYFLSLMKVGSLTLSGLCLSCFFIMSGNNGAYANDVRQIFKVSFLCAFVSTFAWRLYSVFFQMREYLLSLIKVGSLTLSGLCLSCLFIMSGNNGAFANDVRSDI